MKQTVLIRLICLILVLVLSISAFSGCNSSNPKENASSEISSESSTNEDVSDEDTADDTSEDEDTEDEDTEDDSFDDFSDWDDSEEEFSDKKTIYIHNNEIINDNFRGINYVYQLYQRMPDHLGRKYTEKQLQYEYETIDKMGFSMIRSFYGSSIVWDPVKQMHDYDSEYMKAFYESCRDMEKLGIDVGVTMAWDLKSFFKTEVSTEQRVDLYSSGYVVPGDYDATMRNFSVFVKESVLAFKAHGINNIKYIYAFTECNNLYGYDLIARDYDTVIPLYEKALIALDEGLKSSGLRKQYKVVAPCDNWRNDPEYSRLVRHTVEHLSDRADIIGSHNGYPMAENYVEDMFYDYPWEKLNGVIEEAKSVGKEFWVDETNASLRAMLTCTVKEKREIKGNKYRGVAFGSMVNGMMNIGGISNMLIWALVDQQWAGNTVNNAEFDNGVQALGYLPNLMESTIPTAPWYIVSALTRYIGSGKIYNVTDDFGFYASAIERHDGEMTIVVTNYDVTEVEFDMEFDSAIGGKTFYRYLYDANKITPAPGNDMLKPDSVAKNVKTGLTDVVPGMSVAIYTTVKEN